MFLARFVLLSVCMAIIYYDMTIAAIGIAAAGKIFWWFEWRDNFHFYHIAQNFIGIGLAALCPTYLLYSYEKKWKWLGIGVVIVLSMMLQGNINHAPWDLAGLVRFVKNTFFYGDAGSIGVFLEILLWPVLWLLIFSRATRQTYTHSAST